MWIEQRPILFAPRTIHQKGDHYVVESGGQKLEISAQQYQYLDELSHAGMSLHKMVISFVNKGWLVSFRELYALMETMTRLRMIITPEFQSYFHMATNASALGVSDFARQKTSTGVAIANPDIIKSLPFFRTLPKDVAELFVRHTSMQTVAASTRLCKTGDRTREMFVVLEGTVGVYRTFPDGKRQLLSTVPAGSIFGEGGFLLDRARGADVISLSETKLAIIHHAPELSALVDSGKAEILQQRFWVLQGLLASEVFSHMPAETLDSLVFAGKMRNVKAGEILVKEGEPGNSFFIIIQGSIAFSQKGQSLRALSQGGIFGEVALMVSGGKRTATAQAQRDSILLQIDMQEFYTILSNNLILAKEIEIVAWKRSQSNIAAKV